MTCKYVNTCMWSSRDHTVEDFPCRYYAQMCGHPNLTKTQEWPDDYVATGKGRRIIRLSNLALRFYKGDGWTRELVDSYIIRGPKSRDRFPSDHDPYYSVDLQTQLNGKILDDCVLQHCWFWSEGERRRTDRQILKDYGHLPSEYWEKL